MKEGHSIAMHNYIRYCISCQAALCDQWNTAESAAVALLKTGSKNYHNSFIEPVNSSLRGKSTATSWGPSSSPVGEATCLCYLAAMGESCLSLPAFVCHCSFLLSSLKEPFGAQLLERDVFNSNSDSAMC